MALNICQCWLFAQPAFAGLSDYVNAEDASYQYQVTATWNDKSIQFVNLQLVSQTYHGTVWKHSLTLAKPAKLVSPREAILIIGGGRSDQLPAASSQTGQISPSQINVLSDLADRSGLLVAMIEEVPEQPLFGGKLEDEIIAYTLTQYFQTGDDSWPLLLPMTKAVVRAMDTVQDFSRRAWKESPNSFTVSGESKRAWTAWLTAAVDKRVNALIPIVFDMLNIPAQLQHQLSTWGTYSEQLGDYASQGLPKMLATKSGEHLLKIIDPYAYHAHLTQKKMLILGTNDRYWPLDSAKLYYPQLPAPKYLLYLANSGHEPNDPSSVAEARATVALAAANQLTLPEIKTQHYSDPQSGKTLLSVESSTPPERLILMRATSKNTDFREARWSEAGSTNLKHAPNTKTFEIRQESGQYVAAFVTASFALNHHEFKATSEIILLPPRKI
jgi:PhoPQ-activated pathogenicity-related protein